MNNKKQTGCVAGCLRTSILCLVIVGIAMFVVSALTPRPSGSQTPQQTPQQTTDYSSGEDAWLYEPSKWGVDPGTISVYDVQLSGHRMADTGAMISKASCKLHNLGSEEVHEVEAIISVFGRDGSLLYKADGYSIFYVPNDQPGIKPDGKRRISKPFYIPLSPSIDKPHRVEITISRVAL